MNFIKLPAYVDFRDPDSTSRYESKLWFATRRKVKCEPLPVKRVPPFLREVKS